MSKSESSLDEVKTVTRVTDKKSGFTPPGSAWLQPGYNLASQAPCYG
ncbi:hypothetical protein [Legionella steelei]|nr:hypothetical protein [Legionella steelei]